MIKTELPAFESDLMEIVNLFDGVDASTLRHLFSEKENKIVNTIVIGGKSYAYGNLLPSYSDEIEKKRIYKRYAKLSMYKALVAYTGKQMPWGALTGIRPTKLAYQCLENGEDFKEFFINTMKVSPQKTMLIEEVLKEQEGIYKKDDKATDFFVFIPFCPTRCKYCSFITADVRHAKKYIDEYVDALVKEINQSKPLIKGLKSIYVGGGTPISLGAKNLEKVLTALDDICQGVEYTVEAGRPDILTEEIKDILIKHGVNRVCVNPQTFNDKTLKAIGRNHTAQDVVDKYNLVKNSFTTNMDLIAGLGGETFEDFKYSLDMAISLSPDNITVHTLCIKKGSYLALNEQKLKEGEVAKMIDYAKKTLSENGYKAYYLYRQKYMAGNLENTGYTKPFKACKYNIDVMEEITNNIACGAGSISKKIFPLENRIERLASPKDVLTYLEKIDKIIEDKKQFFN